MSWYFFLQKLSKFSLCYISCFSHIKKRSYLTGYEDWHYLIAGANPGFQVRGGGPQLKKLRRAEGGMNIFGVFRVKNHDFMPKNYIFSNCGGRREKFWSISCEKSWFYTKKNHVFSNFRGGAHPAVHPPWICHWIVYEDRSYWTFLRLIFFYCMSRMILIQFNSLFI